MNINMMWVNGLVFGISHHYQLDFDQLEDNEETLDAKMKKVPKVPVVFIHLGPLQFIVSW